jgi:GTP cyclohydrolase I
MTDHLREDKIAKAAQAYAAFCSILGIDLSKPDTQDTPLRIARMMHDEFLVGTRPKPFDFTTFPVSNNNGNQLVNVCGIRLVSLCSHHHFPFIGRAHVCYLPGSSLVGLSKIPRLVRWLAAQPCMQESLTQEILHHLTEYLKPRFVGVRLIADHTCMSARGVNESEGLTSTDAFWCTNEIGKEGVPLDMDDFETTKQEFFRAINEWYSLKRG